jgi:hypothetical protein
MLHMLRGHDVRLARFLPSGIAERSSEVTNHSSPQADNARSVPDEVQWVMNPSWRPILALAPVAE